MNNSLLQQTIPNLTDRFLVPVYGRRPRLSSPSVCRAASTRSRMLWSDLSSAPKMKMARHSAFLASRAACPSGSSGELSARRICRYSDSTTGLFRARSSAVAQISPLPPPPFTILPAPWSPRRTGNGSERVWVERGAQSPDLLWQAASCTVQQHPDLGPGQDFSSG